MSQSEPKQLSVWSFHSVKGGVGKSTLALLTALKLAERGRVALIDMDLTGTSLADVLRLRAPRWDDGDNEILPLEICPSSWTAPDVGLRVRQGSLDGTSRGVPFLNDWFLHARDVDFEKKEICVQSVVWKPLEPDGNLWVIPSSGLPADIARVLPLLYDEPFAAYVEGRLEWLLDSLLEEGVRFVVFDTPPTIPGLSRAVLSMALRLPEHQAMSKVGRTPRRLEQATVAWQPWIVATQDVQDLVAVERWLEVVDPKDAARIGVALNRCGSPLSQIKENFARWRGGSSDEESAGARDVRESLLFERQPVTIRHHEELRLFDVTRDGDDAASAVPTVKGIDDLIGSGY